MYLIIYAIIVVAFILNLGIAIGFTYNVPSLYLFLQLAIPQAPVINMHLIPLILWSIVFINSLSNKTSTVKTILLGIMVIQSLALWSVSF